MRALNRGNPSLLQSIREGARKVSVSNGLAKAEVVPKVQESPRIGTAVGTALEDFSKSFQATQVPTPARVGNPVVSNSASYDFRKSYLDRTMESIQTLKVTKEYYNALSSLLSLYAMNMLNRDILANIDSEDMAEIRGILREFKSILDMQ